MLKFTEITLENPKKESSDERKKHFDGEMRRGGNTSQMWNLLYKRDNK